MKPVEERTLNFEESLSCREGEQKVGAEALPGSPPEATPVRANGGDDAWHATFRRSEISLQCSSWQRGNPRTKI